MAVLEVKNLTKRFGDLEVLKGVSFSLEKGQVLAIIGSSGGGKSTLLRCLNFLETPDKGSISVSGKLLFDLLQTPQTEDSLVQALLEAYEIDTDTARGDVLEFLQILRQNGVLLEDNSKG